MDEPRLKEALSHVRPEWDDERVETALTGLERKQRRRTVLRISGLGVPAAAAMVALVVVLAPEGVTVPIAPAPTGDPVAVADGTSSPNGSFFLPDGSSGVPVDELSRLVVQTVTDDLVSVRVEQGRCDFEVTPRPDRVFEVHAGDVTVTVLGTAFSVGRDGERVHVKVFRGRVRVGWLWGSDELIAGTEGMFPPADSDPPAVAEMEIAETASKAAGAPRPGHKPDWRHYTRSGEFEKAAKALDRVRDVRDTVEDLLLAADAMRLSGSPTRALPYLEQVAKHHRDDPRAQLAEFTRGRVLLLQLGQPRAAAMAFRSSRQLAPKGNLVQDALAREVEAWHRAGEPDTARRLAREYVAGYPNGRRLRAVRRFGGLD